MTHADTAHNLVLGDRNADYGDPAHDFAGVALIWSGLLGAKLRTPITASDVALMMAGLKLRRHAHRPKADNLVDAHGYLTCLEWIENCERPVPRAEQLQQTLEDVCTGARLHCPTCDRFKPCLCP